MIKALLTMTLALTSVGQIFAANQCRCQPDQPCWPNDKSWATLQKSLTGRLIQPKPLLEACQASLNSTNCKTAMAKSKNPFYLQSKPSGSESQGWLGAWTYQNSRYAIEAKTIRDIQAGVNFARQHNLRLVIKGAGHDYLSRNMAPNSLLIWTHKMSQTQFIPNFIPAGCPKTTKPQAAVKVSAGTTWLQAYNQATNQHQRYVQGGGCTTVGAAGGFIQGGGFGSSSKKFGTAAANMLQATVVTADGKVVIANACQNKPLFWALRGGGGGTFGVVAHLTLKTFPVPNYFGIVSGTITAKNDKSYKNLIREFLNFYHQHLNNPHWGEQMKFSPNNTITLLMVSEGLTKKQILENWLPLQKTVCKKFTCQLNTATIPGIKLWNLDYLKKHHPSLATANPLKSAPNNQYWWTGNSGEVYEYWYTYQSWWLPNRLFTEKNRENTAELFYKASRLHAFAFHINKGLAGADPAALTRSYATSTNPSAFKAAGLIIMSSGSNTVYPGIKGHGVDLKAAEHSVKQINQAMALFRQAAPNAGSYVNETNYFDKNWQKDFWGNHYSKLLHIKKTVDPNGLFYCHHCVGSELWNKHGMCRR